MRRDCKDFFKYLYVGAKMFGWFCACPHFGGAGLFFSFFVLFRYVSYNLLSMHVKAVFTFSLVGL